MAATNIRSLDLSTLTPVQLWRVTLQAERRAAQLIAAMSQVREEMMILYRYRSSLQASALNDVRTKIADALALVTGVDVVVDPDLPEDAE